MHGRWNEDCSVSRRKPAGIVEAANAATFRYLNDRRQFGAPLASFQALQHRAANMEIAALELTALLELAIESLSREPTGNIGNALLSALKAVADCGRAHGRARGGPACTAAWA